MRPKKSSAVHVFPGTQYEAFTKLLADVKDAEKIRDSSLAMLRLLEIGADYLERQALAAADQEGKEARHG